MNDTPDYIKKKQLEIWLSKTPAERIRQFCIDNDTLYQFWRQAGNPHLQKTTTAFPISKQSENLQ